MCRYNLGSFERKLTVSGGSCGASPSVQRTQRSWQVLQSFLLAWVLEHTLLCLNKGSRMQPPIQPPLGTTISVFILRDRPSRDLERPRATTCLSLQSTELPVLRCCRAKSKCMPYTRSFYWAADPCKSSHPCHCTLYIDKAWALKAQSCRVCYVPLTLVFGKWRHAG